MKVTVKKWLLVEVAAASLPESLEDIKWRAPEA